jgi:hypothetical protein
VEPFSWQNPTLEEARAAAKRTLVRAIIAKNGIHSSKAETYVEGVMKLLPAIFQHPDRIGLLLAARYTTDPEPIWRNLGLLNREFRLGGRETWKRSPAWAYIKTSRVSLLDLAALEQSRNQFTRARASIMGPVTQTQMWSDDTARRFAAKFGIFASHDSLCLNQAGLAANTGARLALEVRTLAELASSGKIPSSWHQAVELGHGPGPARYHGVLELEELARELGTTMGEARLAGESVLFAMIEGPCNLNIIALGDLDHFRDPDLPVAALRKSGLLVEAGDVETKELLLDIHYYGKLVEDSRIADSAGGDFTNFLRSRQYMAPENSIVAYDKPFLSWIRRQKATASATTSSTCSVQLTTNLIVHSISKGYLRLRSLYGRRTSMIQPFWYSSAPAHMSAQTSWDEARSIWGLNERDKLLS